MSCSTLSWAMAVPWVKRPEAAFTCIAVICILASARRPRDNTTMATRTSGSVNPFSSCIESASACCAYITHLYGGGQKTPAIMVAARGRRPESLILFINIRGRIEEFRLRVPRPHKEGNFDVLDILRDCGPCPILLEVHKIQGIHIASYVFPLQARDIEALEGTSSRGGVEPIGNLLGSVLLGLAVRVERSITILIHSKSNNVFIFRIINGEFARCIWKFFDKACLGNSRWIITSRPYFSGHCIYTRTNSLLYFYGIILAII